MMFPCSPYSQAWWGSSNHAATPYETVYTLIIITAAITVCVLARAVIKKQTRGDMDQWTRGEIKNTDVQRWKCYVGEHLSLHKYTHTHTASIYSKERLLAKGSIANRDAAWSWHPAHQLCQLKHRKHGGERGVASAAARRGRTTREHAVRAVVGEDVARRRTEVAHRFPALLAAKRRRTLLWVYSNADRAVIHFTLTFNIS